MKKSLIFLALLVILIVSVSAHGSRVIAPQTGSTVPALSIESENGVISLNDYKGKYVLLSFWSSTDAPSRVRSNEYEGLLNQDANLSRLSVNLDKNKRLFQEILKNDGLNPEHQLNLSPAESEKVIADFELQSSLRSYLIDPAGKIIAVNPSIETLQSI